jgi:pimeloyl-ACP methyl ester carboxylesterase
MQTLEHRIPNADATWTLSAFQTWSEDRLVPSRNPVLIVPGYGMNSFIFSYHPRGMSLEGYLVDAGFEVWRADLRAQGGSVSTGGTDRFGLGDLALNDLGAVIDAVMARTRTQGKKVDIIGASLGGTIMFIHAVLNPSHKMGSLVAMGSPVKWVRVHPLMKAAFSSPMLVGLVRLKGTRKIAERLLPLLAKHTPWVLSIYMNPLITDTSAAREMVRTVEDPNRRINRQIAHWMRDQDLIIRGVNVAKALKDVTQPLLCVLANGDGIVPRETAIFPYDEVSSERKSLLEVGTDDIKVAHADMFVSDEAHERVFAPIGRWLRGQSAS